LVSSDNQFGFKKRVGCSYAIKTVRSIVDYYVTKCSTVNLCAIDVSEAFDRVNNFASLNKLIKRLLYRKVTVSIRKLVFKLSFLCQMGFSFFAVF